MQTDLGTLQEKGTDLAAQMELLSNTQVMTQQQVTALQESIPAQGSGSKALQTPPHHTRIISPSIEANPVVESYSEIMESVKDRNAKAQEASTRQANKSRRRIRPPLTKSLLFSFLFLGVTGIFANQLLFLIGLNLTSPAYAAALQPGIPVFTFLLAVCIGTEQVDWNEWAGMAKIGGTVVCVLGALLMSIYKGPVIWGDGFLDMHMQGAVFGKPSPEPVGWFAQLLLELGLDTWHIGVFCLIGNCFCMAIYIAFQAPLLTRYPAPLSMTAYSYLFGALCMSLSGLFCASNSSDWILTRPEILSVLYAGLIASALNYGLLTWCNKIVGPSLVALYMPLQPLFSSVLARIFLRSSLYLGRY
ncbi:hypothetical protein L7F22_027508 [Adiantum nelumboides]|nr:hypothetical protein [Adiantum nelumboides]